MRIELCKAFQDPQLLVRALGARAEGLELPNRIRGIATDSRQVRRGDLFVAIEGNKTAGALFLDAAREAGAVALLVASGTPLVQGIACLVTDDPVAALLRAAAERRKVSAAFLTAVSGSTGKTTVKEAVATLFSLTGSVGKSAANFNSQIGMPLSLLALEECERWVLEIGINHIGEMSEMARVASPDLAILTNVGTAHIGNFGSFAALLAEKASIASALREGGRVLVPADLPQTVFRCDPKAVWRFGKGGDFHLENIRYSERGTCADLFCPDRVITNLVWPIAGRVGASVIETVGAVGALLGLDGNTVRAGLALAGEKTPRLALSMAGSRLFIDDAYNASPEAMIAALETLSLTARKRPRVAVLGDMLELGEHAPFFHRAVGKAVVEKRVDMLFTYGNLGGEIAKGARDAGFLPDKIFSFGEDELESLINAVCCFAPQNAVLLFKASGRMGLSRIVSEVRRRSS